jgi:hypothetical protein
MSYPDDLIRELRELPVDMPAEAEQRIRNRIRAEIIRQRRRNRSTRRLQTLAASAAAVLVLAAGTYVVSHHENVIPQTTKHGPAAAQGYDYRGLLGFQPMLPTKAPKGYRLDSIAVQRNLGGKQMSYTFTAVYRMDTDHVFNVTETYPFQMPASPVWNPTQIGSTKAWESRWDGYKVMVNRSDVSFVVDAATSDLQIEDVQNLVQSLEVPVTQEPDTITDQLAGTETIQQRMPFDVVMPTGLPDSYSRQPAVMGRVVTVKGQEQLYLVELRYQRLYQAHDATKDIHIEEYKGDAPQESNVTGVAHGRMDHIDGISVVVNGYGDITSYEWQLGGVRYNVSLPSVLANTGVGKSIVKSMIHAALTK